MYIWHCNKCNVDYSTDTEKDTGCRVCADNERLEKQERDSVLLEAYDLVNGARQEAYADPLVNFERIADIASAITGRVLSPVDCCNVMIAVKLAREIHLHKRDNITDCCGYLEILQRLKDNNGK